MIPIAKPIIPPETYDAVKAVLDSGMIASGNTVQEFMDGFLNVSKIPYGSACSNGTTALDIALRVLDIKAGDEVIVPAFTFIATGNAILYQGATPVFADIDPKTYNIDPQDIRNKITEKTKAIIVVHLFGQAANMPAIMEIAAQHNFRVIEDCAQSHLAQINGQTTGTFGDIGTYSFYPTKNMTTSEGGAVVSKHEALIKRAKIMIDQGQSAKYVHTELGFNYRLTNIAAAIGKVQLKYIEEWTATRRKNAELLNTALADIPWIQTPFVPEGYHHVYHQYVIRLTEDAPVTREELMEELQKEGIGCAIHYPQVMYDQPYYRELGLVGNCPESEKAAAQVLSLPVHPMVSEEEVEYIGQTLRKLKVQSEKRKVTV